MNNTITKDPQKPLSIAQTKVVDRVAKLAGEVVKSLAHKKSLASAANMTDSELLKLIFETQLERVTEMSPRDLRKIAILNEGALKFAERLKELGGTCRASRAADILGVTRQTVSNRITTNKLLAVKIGGEHRIPLFQFDGNRLVDGVEEILSLLGDMSPVTKTSFLTSMYFFDDEDDLNVIDALKKYGSLDEHMDVIRRQATLFGHQVSR